MKFYKFGAFSIFATLEEAERLATDRWQFAQGKPLYNNADLYSLPLDRFLAKAIDEIEIEADLLYSHTCIGAWSIWSDGQIRPYGLKEVYRPEVDGQACNFLADRTVTREWQLSESAAKFVSLIRGSDSILPEWIGEVRDASLIGKTRSEPNPGGYAEPCVEHYKITLSDGTAVDKFLRTEGYFEGYAADVFDSRCSADTANRHNNWTATECLECGAVYESSGHVEPGGMSCDRC